MAFFGMQREYYPAPGSTHNWRAAVLCGLALLLVLTTSCGTQASVSSGGKIPLTLWYWNRSIDDRLLARVNAQFPNIDLHAIKIGGSFDTKLRTTLAGQAGVPDIVGINSNIATYFPDEDQFVDLYTLGARAVQKQYFDWKWQQGQTPSGRLIGFPMDTGPTALFYRADIFRQAGLASDPQTVSTQIRSWDDYMQAAKTILKATGGRSYLFNDIYSVFNLRLSQTGKRFYSPTGQYIGDQSHVRDAWNLAIKVYRLNLSAHIASYTTDWSAAVSNGTIAAFEGAVWLKKRLRDAAPETSSKWRIARAPGGDSNDGGSFLAITRYSAHPREAYAVVSWLMSPKNQMQAYNDQGLFPSTPENARDSSDVPAEPFYGGERTTQIFAEAAKNVKRIYMAPEDDTVGNAFQRALLSIDTQDADPQTAWNDAQIQITKELSH